MNYKIIIISIITNWTFSLFAQQDSVLQDTSALDTFRRQVVLEDVFITANRIPTAYNELMRSVFVIDRKQLDKLPVQSVQEILEYVAGVDVRQRGPMGVQGDVSMRGGTFDQTQILINGVKLNDPQTGHHNLNIPIHPDDIERIEVLKGGGAKVFGQNAFSGSINIVTRKSDKFESRLQFAGGDFNYHEVNTSLTLPMCKKYNQLLSVGYRGALGYRPNTDFGIINGFYQSDLKIKNSNLSFTGGYNEKRFGANSFYTTAFPNQWESTRAGYANVGFKTNLGSVLFQPRIYYRGHEDNFLLKRDIPSFYNNLHQSHVMGLEVNAMIPSSLGTTAVGAEYRSELIFSNRLGNRTRDNVGIFAEHIYTKNWFSIAPGLYFNYFTSFGANIYPGLDMGVRFGENWRTYLSAGRSFRVPTFTDLYYADPVNIGNDSLRPDDAMNYEGGVKMFYPGITGEVAVFYRDGKNLIDWIKQPNLSQWRAENVANVNTYGTEINFNFVPVKIETMQDFPFKRFHIGYSYIQAERIDTGGRYGMNFLQHQAIVGLYFKITEKLEGCVIGKYEVRLNAYDVFLADARVQYVEKWWSFYLEASNLFNTQFQDVNGVPMAPRWVRAGVKFSFK